MGLSWTNFNAFCNAHRLMEICFFLHSFSLQCVDLWSRETTARRLESATAFTHACGAWLGHESMLIQATFISDMSLVTRSTKPSSCRNQ